MSKENKKILSEEDKYIIGKQCCNCHKTTDLEYHHIVPLSLGGSNELSNYCCLCYECHALIHFGKKLNIDHSELTRKGMEKARLSGKQIGQKQGAKLTTKKSIEFKEIITKYSKDFNGKLSDSDVISMIGLSRNTYYKYKKEIKESFENVK
jgi:hypothetical protein